MKSTVCYCLFTVLFVLVGSSVLAQEDQPYSLLWKIEKEGLDKVGYLFGTMHIADERAFGFPDSVMLAIEACEQFALEVHPDTMMRASYEYYLVEDTINYFKEALTEDEYNGYIERFKEKSGLNFEDLENKHPLSVDNFEEGYIGKEDRSTFVDIYLYGIAKTLGKEIIGLEPVQNQFDFIFENKIERARRGKYKDKFTSRVFVDKMIDSYGKGSLEELESMLGDTYANSEVMVKRNNDMVHSITESLQEKTLFAAVGAAHLFGAGNMIDLLQEQGYKLTRVEAEFTGVAAQYTIDPSIVNWDIYTDVIGGYQINFPSDFTIVDQVYPSPTEFGDDTIKVMARMYSDLSKMKNYIITYNDFQIGYYLDSKETMFESVEEELVMNGSQIVSYEEIEHNGYRGRLYNIIFDGSYNAIMHIFFRGNRVYRFVTQNLHANEVDFENDTLINSLKFLPYASCEIKTERLKGIDLPYFNQYRMVEDSNVFDFSYYGKGFSWYADDECTGNTYFVSQNKLKELFYVNNLDGFYLDWAENQVYAYDTLLSTKFVFDAEIKGCEAIIKNKKGDGFERHRCWLTDENVYIHSAYSDSLGLFCDNTDAFFGKSILLEGATQDRIRDDRADDILTALYGQDSLLSAEAVNAFEYCEIDSSLNEKLESLFIEHYKNDSLYLPMNELVMNHLLASSSYDARELCHIVASNQEDESSLRDCAIYKLFEIGDTTEAMTYLFEKMPRAINYNCDVLEPLSNSTDLTYQYFDSIIEKLSNKERTSEMLYLVAELSRLDVAEYNRKIDARYDDIMLHFEPKIDTSDYDTEEVMYSYLLLLRAHSNEKNASHLELIDTIGIPSWLKNHYSMAMLVNDLSIGEADVQELLDTEYFIYDLQKIMAQTNQLKSLPDSLQSTASIYENKMGKYFKETDSYDVGSTLLGKIRVDGVKYYVYRSIERYDGSSYCNLGLVNKSKLRKDKKFDDVKAYSTYLSDCNWKDWKEIAKSSAAVFDLYAY